MNRNNLLHLRVHARSSSALEMGVQWDRFVNPSRSVSQVRPLVKCKLKRIKIQTWGVWLVSNYRDEEGRPQEEDVAGEIRSERSAHDGILFHHCLLHLHLRLDIHEPPYGCGSDDETPSETCPSRQHDDKSTSSRLNTQFLQFHRLGMQTEWN